MENWYRLIFLLITFHVISFIVEVYRYKHSNWNLKFFYIRWNDDYDLYSISVGFSLWNFNDTHLGSKANDWIIFNL